MQRHDDLLRTLTQRHQSQCRGRPRAAVGRRRAPAGRCGNTGQCAADGVPRQRCDLVDGQAPRRRRRATAAPRRGRAGRPPGRRRVTAAGAMKGTSAVGLRAAGKAEAAEGEPPGIEGDDRPSRAAPARAGDAASDAPAAAQHRHRRAQHADRGAGAASIETSGKTAR